MKPRAISLALQGGGSYGAFTWGVLDRLLDDDARIEIKGVSGASAGAINAALLAHGLTIGGRQGARRALADFWGSVAGTLPTSVVESMVFLTRFFSPSQFNPFNLNPVRDLLAKQIDFARLRTDCDLPLFLSATNVRTGMPRLFRTGEISVEVLLASACLPSMHRTVEIDGEAYWDGGLSANPPVRPLLYECEAHDIVLVLLHPDRRPQVPVSAQDISARWTELSFSAALFSELDGISLAKPGSGALARGHRPPRAQAATPQAAPHLRPGSDQRHEHAKPAQHAFRLHGIALRGGPDAGRCVAARTG